MSSTDLTLPGKRQIRAQMRRARRSLSGSERRRKAERLASVVATRLLRRRVHRVACYLPNDGEMDLVPSIELLWAIRRESFLPALHGRRLWFLPYGPHTPLAANRFGIPEPNLTAGRRCPARWLDLVLMPLVAFDDRGNRLGMGGGFYDRTFAYRSTPRRLRKPRLVGVAYEFQRVDHLPASRWDVGLDGIVTENGYRVFARNGREER